MNMFRYSLLAALITMFTSVGAAQEAKLCHIAGSGFYATDGEQGVLMDALFADGMDGDPVASEPLNTALENASGEFANVSLIFASHIHEDHMKAKSILRHLRANDKARAILPEQARLLMAASGIGAEEERIIYSSPKLGENEEIHDLPLAVTIYGLSHGEGSAVDNIGMMVSIAGKTIMQVGDMYGTQEGLGEIEKIKLDYLILPFWYFSQPERIKYINNIFDSEHIIPTHFSLDTSEWMLAQGGQAAVKKRTYGAAQNIVQLDQEMKCIELD